MIIKIENIMCARTAQFGLPL